MTCPRCGAAGDALCVSPSGASRRDHKARVSVSIATRKRREPIETPDYARMMRRFVRRYGARVGQGDPVDLTTMLEIQAELEAAFEVAVAGQIDAGYSWREIGEGLGISKEAAWKRFRPTLTRAG